MASPQAIGARRSAALDSIRRSQSRIASKLNVPESSPDPVTRSDPALLHTSELESVSTFLQNVADEVTGVETTMSTQDNPSGGIQPDHTGGQADNARAQQEQQIRTDANAQISAARAQLAADTADDSETHYGTDKLPLSHFATLSDEEALQLDGIGDATLKRIRKAQAKADKAK